MAKLLGIREVVAAGQLPDFMRKAQAVSIMGVGNYEHAQSGDRYHTPYESQRAPLAIRRAAFGQPKLPYDLGEPGAVAEVKVVLRELAKLGADPLGQDPIVEDTWKHIDTSPEFIDAWDGPTADEFVLAIGRLKPHLGITQGKFASAAPVEHKGRFEIIGGPQPTVEGLELLAQAARKLLKDTVQLDNYLAWRGGDLDEWFGGPPETLVLPTKRFGRQWNPRGWTFAWRDGDVATTNPGLVANLDLLEDSIHQSWNAAQHMQSEAQRLQRADILRDLRQQRHDLVKQLNVGAPPPECEPHQLWSKPEGACVDRCPAPDKRWDPVVGACALTILPGTAPYATHAECIEHHRKHGYSEEYTDTQCALEFSDRGVSAAAVIGLAAVAGLGALWWWKKRGKVGGKSRATVAWDMKAPED